MLFDTDVLIWVLRNNLRAAQLVEAAEERCISVISYMELLRGGRNREEVKEIKQFLAINSFVVLPLKENIGHRALVYIEEYSLHTQLDPADALIAATAVENHLPLCTTNDKHYRAIRELDLKVFRP